MSQLTVSLNDDGLHSITAPDSFETSGPVELLLDNHGEAVHVHLNLDETLSAVADIRANNHYVEPENERPVSVAVNPRSAAVTGRLKIATGYGSEVAYTTISVKPPSEDPNRVTVDESLSKPQREPPAEPTTAEQLADAVAGGNSTGLLVGFGLLAVVLAVAIAVTLESGVVVAGAIVVLLGVIVAVGLAVRV
ncbi:hypothetical protein DM826_06385 [Halonotius aquaticus]|uniref:Uncharacterized protein n=1 Tax=Halonotius aquaticus TaxID=2216978 RepID=A0A3A6Q228_9EURY|nr:hypothetical protein [Halonotius aquaticus]RJX43235.1 hypothetical protein DM826_06385 [Halonotius aquaticus]